MSQKLIAAVARSARLRVLNLLKRTQGLSVQEIADHLGMSYMGIKDLCNDLEKRGLLDARREPRDGSTGRPRMIYRLTGRAHELFPVASNPLTLDLLDAAKKLFGPASAEKLLMLVWQQKMEAFFEKVKGPDPEARADALARARDNAGHMAELEKGSDGRLRIIEHHCPFLDVLRAYPVVARLEVELFRRLLGVSVERYEENAAGLYRAEFVIGG
ncbi:MAG: MarR family transcriptional regulator, partial [Chthoniobacteraceae bacterium]